MSRKKKEKSPAPADGEVADEAAADESPAASDEPAQPPGANGDPHEATAPEMVTPEETARVEDPLVALAKERDEIRNRMLRIAADFENWKKRSRKDQAEAESKAREFVLRDMLEVIDNLERATAAYGASSDSAAVLKGVELVLRLFQSKLERHDVKPIEAKGQPFDPRLHEAIAKVVSTEVPPGNVASEMQRGYRLGDRLLRPAIVTVAAAPEPAGPDGAAEGAPGDVASGEEASSREGSGEDKP